MPNKRTFPTAMALAVLLTCSGTSYAMTPVGKAVTQMPWASGISTWQALDPHHLLVDTQWNTSYLLTLSRACVALTRAQRVGLSASDNVVYAGFDYVTADGERCGIKSISTLSKGERAKLTEV